MMKKSLTALFLCLFSLTANAEAWFYLAGSEDGTVKIYGDAKSLDLDSYKGWIKIEDSEKDEASHVLYYYQADCKAKRVKNARAIIFLKDGKRFFIPAEDASYDNVNPKELNQPIYDWLCKGKYDWFHHMGIEPTPADGNTGK